MKSVEMQLDKLTGKPEITRFKGLGEISPDEFQHFIGEDIRLEPVMFDKAISIENLLKFYMGKNTPDRQEFIIKNLKVEIDLARRKPIINQDNTILSLWKRMKN